MAVDNNTPLSGTPLASSTSTSPQMPGIRTTANGEVLNSNERVVTPAELAARRAAAAGDPKAVGPDGKQKAPGDAAPAEPESENPLRSMLKRVQQAVQNAQEKAAERADKAERDQANAQFFAQNQENRGMFDPVDSSSSSHTPGSTSADSHESHATAGFHPFQAAQNALHHAHDAMLETVQAHLPHQAPAPIVEAHVEYVDHSRPQASDNSAAATAVASHESATHSQPESHAGFHPIGAIADALGHARDQIAQHLPHAQESEQVAQPIGQPDIKVSALEAAAPIREATVADVTHTSPETSSVREAALASAAHPGSPEQVAQPVVQPEIKVSTLEHGAPIREATVSEVTHAGVPIRDAAVAEVTHPGKPEQVAQPIHQPDVKVSALEPAAPIREASVSPVNHPEQVAQPIHQPDIKVSALESAAQHANHSAESLMHGPLAATQSMASGAGNESLAGYEHAASRQPDSAVASVNPAAGTALHGISAVDSAALGHAAQAALDASRPAAHVGVAESVPGPATQVAALNPESHAVHAHASGHPTHAATAAHHPSTPTSDTATVQARDGAQAPGTAQVAQSQQHHDSTHLAGLDNAAAAFMGNAARNAAKDHEAAARNVFANAERPHLKDIGDIDKEMTGLAGLGLASAMGEKSQGSKAGSQEYTGNVSTFAADHQARSSHSEVHKALEEQWAKAGVPAQEAKSSVAAIAPKLDQHLDKPVHPDAKLAYYSKGEAVVAIEHPHHQVNGKPTTSVAMSTLQDVHKHGMPHEALNTIQANLGKDVEGMSKLDLMDKFSPQVVRAISDEGFPHAEVAETKFHLEAGMRNAGAKQPEVSRADALQALGVVATDSNPHVQVTDKTTGQSYQFTTEQLQQSMGFSHDRSTSAPAPAQELAMAQGRDMYSHR